MFKWNKLIGTTFFGFLKKTDISRFWLNILYQKIKKFWKVRKNEFWWHIWACLSHFSRYRVFNCQNWSKILVFTTFFSLVTYYYFTTNKNGQSPKKKSCLLKWPPQLFHFFACDFTRDTTYIPQLDHFSVL